MKHDLVLSLFQDLWIEGAITIRKGKLLWLFGRQNDVASFWAMVVETWSEFAPGTTLRAGVKGDTITLTHLDIADIEGTWC